MVGQFEQAPQTCVEKSRLPLGVACDVKVGPADVIDTAPALTQKRTIGRPVIELTVGSSVRNWIRGLSRLFWYWIAKS